MNSSVKSLETQTTTKTRTVSKIYNIVLVSVSKDSHLIVPEKSTRCKNLFKTNIDNNKLSSGLKARASI